MHLICQPCVNTIEWVGFIMNFCFVSPMSKQSMSGSNHEWTGIFALSVLRLTVQNQIALVERIKVTTESHGQNSPTKATTKSWSPFGKLAHQWMEENCTHPLPLTGGFNLFHFALQLLQHSNVKVLAQRSWGFLVDLLLCFTFTLWSQTEKWTTMSRWLQKVCQELLPESSESQELLSCIWPFMAASASASASGATISRAISLLRGALSELMHSDWTLVSSNTDSSREMWLVVGGCCFKNICMMWPSW